MSRARPLSSRLPHHAATAALRGVVYVTEQRNRVEGGSHFVVAYRDSAAQWVSQPIDDAEQANVAANTLASFLGARIVG